MGDNIVLVGFMATGKSTVGKRLAQRLAFEAVDTDDLIEAKAGKSIRAIFTEEGEEAFRRLESEVAREVALLKRHVIITGGGIVLREENMEALKAAGPVFCLTATAEEILERTRGTAHRPLLQTKDPLATIRELLQGRASSYARADHTVETSGLTVAEVGKRIMQILEATYPEVVQ